MASDDWMEECAAAVRIGEPKCHNGGTLYAGDLCPKGPIDPPSVGGNGSEYSECTATNCAECVCPDGYLGNFCSRCNVTEESCPVSSGGQKPLGCTRDRLIPTAEEQRVGKLFDCECGGGEDYISAFICAELPGISVTFNVLGVGTEEDPARVDIEEFGGVRVASAEKIPGMYNWSFPKIWETALTGCLVSVGECLDVPGTTVGSKECLLIECADTQVTCPPEGYPISPSCEDPSQGCSGINPDGADYDSYIQHGCAVTPESNEEFDFACVLNEQNEDGSHVCYYAQPGGFAPLSLTCQVGTCLYENTTAVAISNHTEWSVRTHSFAMQQNVVAGVSVGLLFTLLSLVALLPGGSTPAKLWKAISGGGGVPIWGNSPSSGGGRGYVDVEMVGSSTRRDQLQATVPPGVKAGDSITLQSPWGAPLTVEVPPGLAAGSIFMVDATPPAAADPRCLDFEDPASQQLTAVGTTENNRAPPPIVLSFENVNFWARMQGNASLKFWKMAGAGRRLRVLSNVSGISNSGRMFAIMGASGAGKTSLLKILSGRFDLGEGDECSGTVRLAGVPVSMPEMRDVSGFVPQEDILPGTLTVRECLAFHALLRVKGPRKHAAAAVRRVLREMRLETVAESMIGNDFQRGISGGEKRRVSIAIVLLSRPALLFLDEPTTGLDSTTAVQLTDILRSIGVTVVLSIHQPNAGTFARLDSVLLLSTAGTVAFCGPTSDVEEYFKPAAASGGGGNPADTMLDICCSRSTEQLAAAFAASEISHANVAAASAIAAGSDSSWLQGLLAAQRSQSAPFLLQLSALCGRVLKNGFRHPLLFWFQYCGTIAMGLCLGSVFSGTLTHDLPGVTNRLGASFFLLFFICLLSMSSLPVWIDSRRLFKAEHAQGTYTHLAHYCSVVICDVVLIRIIPPLVFSLITYRWMGFREDCEDCFFVFCAVLVLLNIVTTLVCMGMGALAPSNASGNVLGSIAILFFCMFSGFVSSKRDLSPALASASAMNYGFEALMINELVDPEPDSPTYYAINGSYCSPHLPYFLASGNKILETFHLSESVSRRNSDLRSLLFMGLVCLGLSYCFLRYRDLAVAAIRRSITRRCFGQRDVERGDDACGGGGGDEGWASNSGTAHSPAPRLSWPAVNLKVRMFNGHSRQILRNVSGDIGGAGCNLLGLMGPSGAGKTSLLDVVAGRKTIGTIETEGGNAFQVTVDGRKMSAKEVRDMSGYVLQEDILPMALTVQECLEFHARLRIDDADSRGGRVGEIKTKLGITHVAATNVRDLSGGERRRVTIATELLSRPRLLFLDEPTTGLDASTSLKIMRVVSEIARSGTAVVMSIHQPRTDIFQMLDRVLVLTMDGAVGYFGGVSSVPWSALGLDAASIDDPAESLIGAIADASVDRLNALLPDSSLEVSLRADVSATLGGGDDGATGGTAVDEGLQKGSCGEGTVSCLDQFRALAWRLALVQLRDPYGVFLNYAVTAVAAAVFAHAFHDLPAKNEETAGTQNRLGLMFVLCTYLALLSLGSLPLWQDHMALFVRERASGVYGTLPFFLATMLSDILPLRLAPPVLFGIISYSEIGLNDGPHCLVNFVVVLMLCNCAMAAICMAISAVAPSNMVANTAGSLVVLFCLLFSGFLVRIDTVPTGWRWMEALSPTRFAYEALCTNEFAGQGLAFRISTAINGQPDSLRSELFLGEAILRCFSLDPDSFGHNVHVLCWMVMLWLSAVFVLLFVFVKERR